MLDGNGEKKTIWKYILRWGLLVLGLALGAGGAWSFYVESNRNYGQLATSLITISGVVLTLWMAHERAIEQQEKEDERHNARLESESTRHDERLRTESEREHKRLIAEAQKDRAQRSITQRIDLAEKLAAAIGHLYDENELKQAAGVQEILFQIDDWHALIKSEIAGIEGDKAKKDALEQEGLRHRQELFDIAYKFDTENMHVLKSRARGLKQRLRKEGPYSLMHLDFSGMVIGCSIPMVGGDVYLDLKGIVANEFVMSNAKMSHVDLSDAYLELVVLDSANLESAKLYRANLESAKLNGANLESAKLKGANLKSADVKDADFKYSDLRFAKINDAKGWEDTNILSCANVEGSDIEIIADVGTAHLESSSDEMED